MIHWPRFGRDCHAHPLVLVKLLLARVMTILEFCHRCGARVHQVWWAPPGLWITVMGTEAGVRCVDCFDRECSEHGLLLRWSPRLGGRS